MAAAEGAGADVVQEGTAALVAAAKEAAGFDVERVVAKLQPAPSASDRPADRAEEAAVQHASAEGLAEARKVNLL